MESAKKSTFLCFFPVAVMARHSKMWWCFARKEQSDVQHTRHFGLTYHTTTSYLPRTPDHPMPYLAHTIPYLVSDRSDTAHFLTSSHAFKTLSFLSQNFCFYWGCKSLHVRVYAEGVCARMYVRASALFFPVLRRRTKPLRWGPDHTAQKKIKKN
jgi:hypothetical protein